MKTIIPGRNEEHLQEALERFRNARQPLALTGAGISVNSGIADFRSPGGVWTIFSPDEYATLSVFRRDPQKAWKLYRELGKTLVGKKPNSAHLALAQLEQKGLLDGVITQNVDNLHQQAGSTRVYEIHGDHQHLQCLECGDLIPVKEEHYSSREVPLCGVCSYPYKPNVVLFEEPVRHMEKIEALIYRCDLLMVIGTSAQVYPAAGLPAAVKQNGGLLYEFNQDQALSPRVAAPTYHFQGDLADTMLQFARPLL